MAVQLASVERQRHPACSVSVGGAVADERRGPLNKPKLIESFEEFVDEFGHIDCQLCGVPLAMTHGKFCSVTCKVVSDAQGDDEE